MREFKSLSHGRFDTCRLCGGGEYVTLAREEHGGFPFTIARCLNCSLVYVPEIYAEVSPDYTALSLEGIDEKCLWIQGEHKRRAFIQCLSLFDSLAPHTSKRRCLLDVGCGTAQWLAFAGSRFEIYGFDASASQIDSGRAHAPRVRKATNLREYERELG